MKDYKVTWIERYSLVVQAKDKKEAEELAMSIAETTPSDQMYIDAEIQSIDIYEDEIGQKKQC